MDEAELRVARLRQEMLPAMPTRCVMGPPLVCFTQNEQGNYPYLFNNY